MKFSREIWRYAFFSLLVVNFVALVYLLVDKEKEPGAEKLTQSDTVEFDRLKEVLPVKPVKKEGLPKPTIPVLVEKNKDLHEICNKQLEAFTGDFKASKIRELCAQTQVFDQCYSQVDKTPIFHFDKNSRFGDKGQRILVLSLVHGDEGPSASVALSWMERLSEINPRNTWRVLPIVNPDGYRLQTRTNGNGVDINRNYPTADWTELAHKYWKKFAKSSERRFPGKVGGSEAETRCTIRHIQEFQPDFIIAIHTPLGLLDFDGPTMIPFPKFAPLPWRSLGHFPGSLGRYMWRDHGVPVLTVELKGGKKLARKSLEQFDQLQDITGTVAIQSQRAVKELGIEQKTPDFKTKVSNNSKKNDKDKVN